MRATILGTVIFCAAACDQTRTVDRSGLSSFKVNVVCASEYESDCPAIPDGGAAMCPASPVAPVLGSPILPVPRSQSYYTVQVVAYDGNGNVKTDYSGIENVYIEFEGSVTPTRSPIIPPLATVNVQNGYGCLGIAIPPAFNETNIWVEEPTTYTVDAGHRWPQGSYTIGASETIYRPAPLISDVAYTSDPVEETSALNNKHVIIDTGDQGKPIVVTYVSANYFTVTDLGAELGPDHAWGSLELYTYSQPYGVKIGTVVSHLNGSVQNFLGLPELNFPVWTVEHDPDPALAPVPAPHRLFHTDITITIPNMAAYKSGLVQIKSDSTESWIVCGLNGSNLASYYKYGEWIAAAKGQDCGNTQHSFDIVTTSGVPDFDPLANAGKKICSLSGILTLVVPTPSIDLWTITPRNLDDFPVSGIVDATTPCPP